ncbi:hypothetical protein GMRT_12963 [Giardia muris]|uniref:WD40 repeat protein n=1 Tax=Giardia muris TaxID=5742 RepID=A0A4Z1T689_GIAMU|nr:hypothetical protein GMRT_12963 [Giardia muris]|eukprot:TNJ29573.1 hypothetical protein GMRT_12963 [Giardia muris]
MSRPVTALGFHHSRLWCSDGQTLWSPNKDTRYQLTSRGQATAICSNGDTLLVACSRCLYVFHGREHLNPQTTEDCDDMVLDLAPWEDEWLLVHVSGVISRFQGTYQAVASIPGVFFSGYVESTGVILMGTAGPSFLLITPSGERISVTTDAYPVYCLQLIRDDEDLVVLALSGKSAELFIFTTAFVLKERVRIMCSCTRLLVGALNSQHIVLGEENGNVRCFLRERTTTVVPHCLFHAHVGPIRSLILKDDVLYSGGEDGALFKYSLTPLKLTKKTPDILWSCFSSDASCHVGRECLCVQYQGEEVCVPLSGENILTASIARVDRLITVLLPHTLHNIQLFRFLTQPLQFQGKEVLRLESFQHPYNVIASCLLSSTDDVVRAVIATHPDGVFVFESSRGKVAIHVPEQIEFPIIPLRSSGCMEQTLRQTSRTTVLTLAQIKYGEDVVLAAGTAMGTILFYIFSAGTLSAIPPVLLCRDKGDKIKCVRFCSDSEPRLLVTTHSGTLADIAIRVEDKKVCVTDFFLTIQPCLVQGTLLPPVNGTVLIHTGSYLSTYCLTTRSLIHRKLSEAKLGLLSSSKSVQTLLELMPVSYQSGHGSGKSLTCLLRLEPWWVCGTESGRIVLVADNLQLRRILHIDQASIKDIAVVSVSSEACTHCVIAAASMSRIICLLVKSTDATVSLVGMTQHPYLWRNAKTSETDVRYTCVMPIQSTSVSCVLFCCGSSLGELAVFCLHISKLCIYKLDSVRIDALPMRLRPSNCREVLLLATTRGLMKVMIDLSALESFLETSLAILPSLRLDFHAHSSQQPTVLRTIGQVSVTTVRTIYQDVRRQALVDAIWTERGILLLTDIGYCTLLSHIGDVLADKHVSPGGFTCGSPDKEGVLAVGWDRLVVRIEVTEKGLNVHPLERLPLYKIHAMVDGVVCGAGLHRLRLP